MKSILKTFSIVSMAAICASSLQAGTITVKNENTKVISLDIVPKGGSKDFVYQQKLSGEHSLKFDITPANLGGKSIYAIIGKTGLTEMVSGDKCENLSTDKDYSVTFTDDKVGTTCVAVPTN